MMYHVQYEKNEFSQVMRTALSRLTSSEPDMFIEAQDGVRVYTHRLLLSAYSHTFAQLVQDCQVSTEMTGVLIPDLDQVHLVNLIKLLRTGLVFSTESSQLTGVRTAASLLGISISDMQLGMKKPQTQRKHSIKKREVQTSPSEIISQEQESRPAQNKSEVAEKVKIKYQTSKLDSKFDDEEVNKRGRTSHRDSNILPTFCSCEVCGTELRLQQVEEHSAHCKPGLQTGILQYENHTSKENVDPMTSNLNCSTFY